MTINERVKKRRIELGMSVDDLAELLHKNRATIYRYESQEIDKFPLEIVVPLSEALKTTPQYLMGWTDDTETPKDTSSSEEVQKAMDLYEKYKNALPQVQEIVENLLKSSRPDP